MSLFVDPSDAPARERATTTFDRNVVVTAGAGTGKTTLLVDRMVHLLVRNPAPLKVTDIVALTFTNKAATEMKIRLRERLHAYLITRLDQEPADAWNGKLREAVESLIRFYRLSKDELDARAREALRNIERSEIGTIHSFAATLLRLYPMEAGVDPQFREDDGAHFERIFTESWDLWLDQQLSARAPCKDDWKKVLKKLSLGQIKELAVSLCAETVDLDGWSAREPTSPDAVRAWLADLENKAATLLENHPEDRTNEKLVRAAILLIRAFRRSPAAATDEVKEAAALLRSRSINKNLNGWLEKESADAQALVRVARGLCQVDHDLTGRLWTLLVPFARACRERFVHEGYVSFDGLLVRARNLVRDYPHVREDLKRRFQAILIDEFQDTDPIQYEILLYLAEQAGQSAKDWRSVNLAPGKIFVVGDPKQSIYAFRRADIEAYLEVIEKIIKAQDGVECLLTTNFRSHAGILDAVNGVFEPLIRARDRLQPPYIAIHPAADSSGRYVEIRAVRADGSPPEADTARKLEAESLARWLEEEVLGKAEITTVNGERAFAQAKDVAILLRKLTDLPSYIEPLRRRGFRYIVEGERHFYAVKEIVDAVNALRAVENPNDKLALVGILRSPLGGLADAAIYRLHREGLLDYRAVGRLRGKNFPPSLQPLYATLLELHRQTASMPVGEAVAHVFAKLPIPLLAACGFHGEQALANLEKLRDQADVLGREGSITLKEAIHQLHRRVLEVKDEGESALAEESLDAIRIMSIHKAKGLEFPIVVVAGCHTGIDPRQGVESEIFIDWSSGLLGTRVGQTWDLTGLYLAEQARVRAEEEQKRVLYVAMTRARDHLVLSGVSGGRRSSGSFFSLLVPGIQDAIEIAETSVTLAVGQGRLELQIVKERLAAPGTAPAGAAASEQPAAWGAFADGWRRRGETWARAAKTPLFLTPTLIKSREEEFTEAARRAADPSVSRSRALLTGELAHWLLQHWDFTADPQTVRPALQELLENSCATDAAEREWLQQELERILAVFFASRVYAELKSSRILGRELPFVVPWENQIMEGVIDLLYEKNGALYLADYKTDRIDRKGLQRAAERYRDQARIYSRAVRLALRKEAAAFKLIFLRTGEAIEIPTLDGGAKGFALAVDE